MKSLLCAGHGAIPNYLALLNWVSPSGLRDFAHTTLSTWHVLSISHVFIPWST